MDPDKYKAILLAAAPECSRLCSCGVALCINQRHQPWICECGHTRTNHMLAGIGWYPFYGGIQHPHHCYIPGCDCTSLQFDLFQLLSQEEIVAGLRDIERALRLQPPLGSNDGHVPPL